MHLAFRRGANPGAKWYEKVAASVIQWRLTTIWPHCGLVIQDTLYHATAKGGLVAEPFIYTDNWDLYDCGKEDDAKTIAYFNERLKEAGGKVRYDWFSLLAFTPAIFISKLFGSEIRYSNWLYCYEWCMEVLTGERAKAEVTAELVFREYFKKYKAINR